MADVLQFPPDDDNPLSIARDFLDAVSETNGDPMSAVVCIGIRKSGDTTCLRTGCTTREQAYFEFLVRKLGDCSWPGHEVFCEDDDQDEGA